MMSWRDALSDLRSFLDEHDKERTFRFSGELQRRYSELEDRVKELIIHEAVGSALGEAYRWVRVFKEELEAVKKCAEVREVLMTRELKSFIASPRDHLKKKIMFYLHDVLRDVISVDTFEEKAFAAVKTSLRTNMRTIYQDWILLSAVEQILSGGGAIVYPESKVLSLERSGAQRIGWIPPNMVLRLPGKGYISVFIEAPRPIGWGDTKDLRRIWKLYTALRPDMMVYSGIVMNILDPSSDPPVKRPDLIIEVKELADWYERMREVRGPFAQPLTVERWRSMWIEGLWEGLAGILGVKRRKRGEEAEEEKKVKRLRDVEIVKLYKAFYKPRYMVVVTRRRTPSKVRRELEDDGIIVIDKVGFRKERLSGLVRILEEVAGRERELRVSIAGELYDEIRRLAERYGVAEEEVASALIRLGLSHSSELGRVLQEARRG